MSRIIGCNSLHLAEVISDSVSETTFGKPFAVPSLISIDIKDNSENITFYSDDVVEQVLPSFSGKEVTVELGYLSQEIESKISGHSFEGGVFKQKANATAKEYAALFKAPLSRGGDQYVMLCKGVFSIDEAAYKTKEDKVESQTVKLNGVFMPLLSTNDVMVRANSTDGENSEVVSKWFTKLPVGTTQEEDLMTVKSTETKKNK